VLVLGVFNEIRIVTFQIRIVLGESKNDPGY